jgi:NADPH:quinone reductase
MRAVRVHEVGSADALTLEDIPEPSPGEGEVLIRVEAAGVNFIDVYQRTGQYPMDLPMTVGSEAAGVISRVGPGVTALDVGDRVASASVAGGYAEQAVAPADKVVRIPDEVDSRTAAAVMLQGLTAHYLATSTVRIEAGMTVLCYAAAGGVGHLLVQILKGRGARVLGTASTEEKARLARDAGADEVILYREVDIAAEVHRLTDGEGVPFVYDSVGADTFASSLDCLQRRGTLVLYGQSSGAVDPVSPQTLAKKGSVFLTRPTLGDYIATRDELSWRAGELLRWLGAGELEVRVDRTWPLESAAEAHRYLEDGRTQGKLLLIP